MEKATISNKDIKYAKVPPSIYLTYSDGEEEILYNAEDPDLDTITVKMPKIKDDLANAIATVLQNDLAKSVVKSLYQSINKDKI